MSQIDAPAEKTQPAVSRSFTDTRLQGYRLVIVRLLCLSLSIVSVGLVLANIPSYFASLHLLCTGTAAPCSTSGQLAPADLQRLQALGLSIDFFATYIIVLTSLFALGYWLVAALLFWRTSDNPLALLAAVTLSTFPIAFNTDPTGTLSSSWSVLAHVISLLGNVCIVLFFYVFPGGHFVPRWTRWVLIPTLAYGGFNEFFPQSPFNPFFRFPLLDSVTFLVVIGGMLVVQIYRYRRVSTPTQRQQTKWVVYGVTLGVGGFVLLILLRDFFPSLSPTGSLADLIARAAMNGLVLLLPFSIGVAVWRSRLWEIDRIINQTLVYATLTVTLALVYAALIIGLPLLVHELTGQIANSPLILVGSTLAIAALFQPLRKRIQQVIDRRFYRRKYDAARTLVAFSATLRSEVDLHELSEQILAVVQETMQPAHISLWLRHPEPSRERNTRLLPRFEEQERPSP